MAFNNEFRSVDSQKEPLIRSDKRTWLSQSGPYIGIVKNNQDSMTAGRLQVCIPDLGGEHTQPQSWHTVSYASPFRGKTLGHVQNMQTDLAQQSDIKAPAGQENGFQSYGMWFVPPDIGVRVLCLFINGDPLQGYWFACIGDASESGMTPGVAAVPTTNSTMFWNPETYPTHKAIQDYVELPGGIIPSQLPASEPTVDERKKNPYNPRAMKRHPHAYQSMRLGIQGLVFDKVRGTTTASSLRESPSQVFGVSTPGRFWMMADKVKSKNFLASKNAKNLLENYRVGGNQIILDDGDVNGEQQGIRIRTAKGNMILLDDTNEQIYVTNAAGTAWIELSPSGRIDVFAQNDFSVRTKGSLNLFAEKNVNVHAGGSFRVKTSAATVETMGKLLLNSKANVQIFGLSGVKMESIGPVDVTSQSNATISATALLTLKSKLVSINPPSVSGSIPSVITPPTGLSETEHPETFKGIGGAQTWWPDGKIKSIVTHAPDHEPWGDHEINSTQGQIGSINGAITSVPQTSGHGTRGITAGFGGVIAIAMAGLNAASSLNPATVEKVLGSDAASALQKVQGEIQKAKDIVNDAKDSIGEKISSLMDNLDLTEFLGDKFGDIANGATEKITQSVQNVINNPASLAKMAQGDFSDLYSAVKQSTMASLGDAVNGLSAEYVTKLNDSVKNMTDDISSRLTDTMGGLTDKLSDLNTSTITSNVPGVGTLVSDLTNGNIVDAGSLVNSLTNGQIPATNIVKDAIGGSIITNATNVVTSTENKLLTNTTSLITGRP